MTPSSIIAGPGEVEDQQGAVVALSVLSVQAIHNGMSHRLFGVPLWGCDAGGDIMPLLPSNGCACFQHFPAHSQPGLP